MYSRILIATDGSELAGKAVEHGLRLAKSVNAPVVLVTVTEIWSALEMASKIESGRRDAMNAVEAYETAARSAARGILEKAAQQAASMDVVCETRHVNDQRPAEGIINTAARDQCDLIVMASHGRRGVQKMLLGSQTAEVLALSKTPVLVLR